MSVCFELYAVINDPDLKISGFDFQKCRYTFTDNKPHEYIDLRYNKGLCKIDKMKSVYSFITKIAKKFTLKYFDGKVNSKEFSVYPFHYIIVDCLCASSGWFFKKRYFKKKSWIYFAVTKKQMENFFDRYFNYNKPEAIEYKKIFLDKWEEEEKKGNYDLLFRCGW